MTTLLDKIRGIKEEAETKLRQSKEDDHNEYLQIATRELLGKTKKGDAERLASLMESLGRDESEYTDLLDSLNRLCRMLGVQEFHDQNAGELEEQGKQLAERAAAADALRLELVHAGAKLASLTREADRASAGIINAKKRVAFIFDGEGTPSAAIRPLIQAEFDRQVKQCKEATEAAGNALAAAAKLPA